MHRQQLFNLAYERADTIKFKHTWRDDDGSFIKITQHKLQPGKMLSTRCQYSNIRLLLIGTRCGTFVIREIKPYAIIIYRCDVPVGFSSVEFINQLTKIKTDQSRLLKEFIDRSSFMIHSGDSLENDKLKRLIGIYPTYPNISEWIEKILKSA